MSSEIWLHSNSKGGEDDRFDYVYFAANLVFHLVWILYSCETFIEESYNKKD